MGHVEEPAGIDELVETPAEAAAALEAVATEHHEGEHEWREHIQSQLAQLDQSLMGIRETQSALLSRLPERVEAIPAVEEPSSAELPTLSSEPETLMEESPAAVVVEPPADVGGRKGRERNRSRLKRRSRRK